ncbi:MAG: hypothetical protein ACLTA0_01670 [Streptococcus agalactiae]
MNAQYAIAERMIIKFTEFKELGYITVQTFIVF